MLKILLSNKRAQFFLELIIELFYRPIAKNYPKNIVLAIPYYTDSYKTSS